MAKTRTEPLLKKIEALLRPSFPTDTIDVSLSGIRDNIHVIVVSRTLDGLSESEKQERLWELLEGGGLAKNELGRISLLLPVSVEELKR